MVSTHEKTLRLLFPQWQGGNNAPYFFGAQLLSWLAPAARGPVEEVRVAEPDGQPLQVEDGIVARTALLKQLKHAQSLIEKHQPNRMVILGGDCLVDLAPFAYLNELYEGELADTSEPVLKWLKETGAKHLAIHLDLDVLDPSAFRSLLFANPNAPEGAFEGIAQGKMTIEQVMRLLSDVAKAVDVVGLGVTEHLPWDSLALKNMLANLPLLGNTTND